MPPRNASRTTPARKKTPARHKQPAAKKAARRAKAQPLAIAEAVKRETPRGSVFDRQLAIIETLLAWTPARMLASQQAAFWQGFAGGDEDAPGKRKPTRKRAARK